MIYLGKFKTKLKSPNDITQKDIIPGYIVSKFANKSTELYETNKSVFLGRWGNRPLLRASNVILILKNCDTSQIQITYQTGRYITIFTVQL